MPARKPKLTKHKPSGCYRIKYRGKTFSLGSDAETARKRYADHVRQWAQWIADKEAVRAARRRRRQMQVADLFESFITDKATECSDYTLSYYRTNLARFVTGFHARFVDSIEPWEIQKFKTRLMKTGWERTDGKGRIVKSGPYSPKSIGHQIDAIRALFRYGSDMGFCPELNLRGVKKPPVPPPDAKPKAYTMRQVMAMVSDAPDYLKPWIVLQFNTACRPSEVVHMAHGRWRKFDGPKVIELTHHKTARHQRRIILLSAQASRNLQRVCDDPRYARGASYYRACERSTGRAPHALRHAAATRLIRRLGEAERAVVDRILGHRLPERAVSQTYARIRWRDLVRITEEHLSL